MMMYHHDMNRDQLRRSALDQVLEVALLLNDDMAHSLGQLGLTPSRTHLLWELRSSGPTTQQALARAMGVSPRNVTGLVDGLAATGFVSRQEHPTDRRATLVTFTAHGEATVRALERDHQHLARQLFSGMSDDRFECFTAGLQEVLVSLHRAVAEHEQQNAAVSKTPRPAT